MLETDAPYLLPRNIKPKPKNHTNVPANLTWIAMQLAEIIGIDVDTIAAETTKNTKRFFSLST